MEKKIKLFVGSHCAPCERVKELVQGGQFLVDNEEGMSIEMIDVESDEGFPAILEHNLSGIPSAIDESGKQCRIRVDEEGGVVLFECGDSGDSHEVDSHEVEVANEGDSKEAT